MYAGYAELEQLPAVAYLDWQKFETPFDSMPSNVARQQDRYNEGLETGRNAKEFHLSVRGVWSTENRVDANGYGMSYTSSYEGIGYHANTAHFLHGILDSGCPVIVHRRTDSDTNGTQIK